MDPSSTHNSCHFTIRFIYDSWFIRTVLKDYSWFMIHDWWSRILDSDNFFPLLGYLEVLKYLFWRINILFCLYHLIFFKIKLKKIIFSLKTMNPQSWIMNPKSWIIHDWSEDTSAINWWFIFGNFKIKDYVWIKIAKKQEFQIIDKKFWHP